MSTLGRKQSEATKQKLREINLGKKLSPETRQKMSQNHSRHFLGKKHTQETIQINREKHLGNKNASGERSKQSIENISNSHKKENLPLEVTQSYSAAAKRRWQRGDFDTKGWNESHTKNGWCKPGYYNNIYMLSRIERRTAFLLDFQGIKWSYEPKRFSLKALNTTYKPDFYLPEFNIWLEVKYLSFNIETTLTKMEQLRIMGENISLVTHKDVKELETLLGAKYDKF